MIGVTLASNLTQRSYAWTAWRSAYLSRGIRLQYIDHGDHYFIWFYDVPEVHLTTIWKGEVPYGVVNGGYTQEQNDVDKADWEARFKYEGNRQLSPQTSDGKNIVLPNLFPGGVTLYYAGCGDDVSTPAVPVRGGGTLFALSRSSNGDSALEWQFGDWIYVSGGLLVWKNALVGDYISMEVFAPATAVTNRAGNDGNCNIVTVGGVPFIVPAAGNGAKQVDLAAAVPIPSDDSEDGIGSGYWSWDKPDTLRGTIAAQAEGDYHLINAEVILARFVAKVPMVESGQINYSVPAIKPKRILPQWKWRVTMHAEGSHALAALNVAWSITTARIRTV